MTERKLPHFPKKQLSKYSNRFGRDRLLVASEAYDAWRLFLALSGRPKPKENRLLLTLSGLGAKLGFIIIQYLAVLLQIALN